MSETRIFESFWMVSMSLNVMFLSKMSNQNHPQRSSSFGLMYASRTTAPRSGVNKDTHLSRDRRQESSHPKCFVGCCYDVSAWIRKGQMDGIGQGRVIVYSHSHMLVVYTYSAIKYINHCYLYKTMYVFM